MALIVNEVQNTFNIMPQAQNIKLSLAARLLLTEEVSLALAGTSFKNKTLKEFMDTLLSDEADSLIEEIFNSELGDMFLSDLFKPNPNDKTGLVREFRKLVNLEENEDFKLKDLGKIKC